LLLGGEEDVLSISETWNCLHLLGDCNRTRVSIFLPVVDPPGVWSGHLSIKGNPVLDFNTTYFMWKRKIYLHSQSLIWSLKLEVVPQKFRHRPRRWDRMPARVPPHQGGSSLSRCLQ
jgi:hypothetical protein